MIESSPPQSAESSFRELDEVFLQTQTRIWLGELLNMRLDDDLPLSDLLQDGEILFEVSKVVWDLLLTKCMELRHLKHKYGPFGSKKSSGRYRPYSNVDSFLKICKILGLSGIDLFSPSDVVEKRDIRKVCICIRALSKKARSKQLSVPDFDMVTYSVTMPTDMVGVIRRSLESSQWTLSSSSSYSSRKGSQMKLKQKNIHAACSRDDESSSSEESDEAESRYMGENNFSSASKYDSADGVNSDLENSPETNSISELYMRQNVAESDVQCQCTEDFNHGQCKSASVSDAVQSLVPDESDKTSCCCISKKKLYHGMSHINSEERHDCRNGNVDVPSTNFTLENDDPFMGDSSCIEVGERNYISDYLAFSDLMVHATDGTDSVVLDGENNMFDFFLNVESQRVNLDKRGSHNGSQRIYSDDEDMEVSSTTSMSSVLGRLLNLEFDNQFDEDDSSSTNVLSSVSKEHESEKHYKDSFILSEPQKKDTFDTQSHTLLFDSREAQSSTVRRLSSSTKYFLPSQDECEISSMESPKGKSCDARTSNPENDFCLESRGVVVANDNNEMPIFCEDKDKEIVGSTILGSDIIQVFNSQDALPIVSDDTNIHRSIIRTSLSESNSYNHPCLPVKDMNIAQVDTHVAYSIQHNTSSTAENGSQDNREHSQDSLTEIIPEGRKDTTAQPPSGKHKRRLLLKTVVKGTAIAGVLFLLLHINSKSRGNNAQETTENARFSKYNGTKSSSTKQQTRGVGKGIYPTDKIKLGS